MVDCTRCGFHQSGRRAQCATPSYNDRHECKNVYAFDTLPINSPSRSKPSRVCDDPETSACIRFLYCPCPFSKANVQQRLEFGGNGRCPYPRSSSKAFDRTFPCSVSELCARSLKKGASTRTMKRRQGCFQGTSECLLLRNSSYFPFGNAHRRFAFFPTWYLFVFLLSHASFNSKRASRAKSNSARFDDDPMPES